MMMQDFIRKTISRRGLLSNSGASLGTLFLIAQATGIPIPLLMRIDRAMALEPVETKLFLLIENRDGIRPNDFNIPEDVQPEFLDRNWGTGELVPVQFGEQMRMLPPGIGNLAAYGDRMAVMVGADTNNNGHGGGSRNATTNATAGATPTSMHTIVGRASNMVLPSVAFSGTNGFTDGAQSGGVSPQAFLNSLEVPPGPSAAVLNRLDQFRNAFHNEITTTLNQADQEVVSRYWDSNGSFKEAKERAQELFLNPPPPNNFLGQMQMANRVFQAGLANSFLIDGTGGQGFGFDTHGNNNPQRNLSRTMSNNIATFLDEMDAAGQLENVNIVITSAFGRNPTFNGNGGDDHLPSNGHFTLIGPDFVPGAYGRTTNTSQTRRGVTAWAVDKATGATGGEINPGGNYIQMNAGNVLKSVGNAIGVPRNMLDQYFPNADVLDFLAKP